MSGVLGLENEGVVADAYPITSYPRGGRADFAQQKIFRGKILQKKKEAEWVVST